MKPRLAIVLVLIVLAPLAVIGYLGLRAARGEQAAIESAFRQLLAGRLADVDAVIQGVLSGRSRELAALAGSTPAAPGALRALVKGNPLVRHAFAIRADGTLVYPSPRGDLSRAERDFLSRTQPLWDDWRQMFRPALEGDGAAPALSGPLKRGAAKAAEAAPGPAEGWYRYLFGSGLHLIFWRRVEENTVVGFEIERFRLVSDIMEQLPARGPSDGGAPGGRIVLLDATGDVLHQWGSYAPEPGTRPMASAALGPPLEAWRLELFAPRSSMKGAAAAGVPFALLASLVAAGLVLGGLAFYLYRESGREIREARERVSFVNQVSHELKTPLTNIRMYAELLDESVPEDDEKARRHVSILVAESQRLSRLIENVLAFARHQRGTLGLRKKPDSPDRVIRSVVQSFAPAFVSKGIAIEHQPGAPGPVLFDPDALEQILGNLVGNVEKYAAAGGYCGIVSRTEPGRTKITVTDRGPGIPLDKAEAVFAPFFRLSTKTTDGVAGTGIGLGIARELARLHGGDLLILQSGPGAVFEISLPTLEGPDEGADSRG
ncbi:MAG: HAMP domain-containing histidine kinase [Deltaproteobacteria bacterium]|nr:HAMP domain-containing histidine kinase [Deltaproteobacteria bacterium]